jgi:hypothetical protein
MTLDDGHDAKNLLNTDRLGRNLGLQRINLILMPLIEYLLEKWHFLESSSIGHNWKTSNHYYHEKNEEKFTKSYDRPVKMYIVHTTKYSIYSILRIDRHLNFPHFFNEKNKSFRPKSFE